MSGAGTYVVVNNATGTAMHPDGGTIAASRRTDAPIQQWALSYSGGSCVFKNVETGKCLGIPSDASAGRQLVATSESGASRWKIDGNVIALSDNPGLVADLSRARSGDRTPVLLYNRSNASNQQWNFFRV